MKFLGVRKKCKALTKGSTSRNIKTQSCGYKIRYKIRLLSLGKCRSYVRLSSLISISGKKLTQAIDEDKIEVWSSREYQSLSKLSLLSVPFGIFFCAEGAA